MSVCIANRFDNVEEEEEDISTQNEQVQSEQVSSVGAVGSVGSAGGIGLAKAVGSAGGISSVGGISAIGAKQQSSQLLQQQQQTISKTGISATNAGVGGLSGLSGGFGRGSSSGQAISGGVGNSIGSLGVGGVGAVSSGASLGSGAVVASSSSVVQKEVEKTAHHSAFDSFSTGIQTLTPSKFTEWSKLIFKPFELVKAIATHFALDLDKFILTIGDGLVFGAEAVLTPYVASVKIIEKIFVPNACLLKFFCGIGKQFSIMKGAAVRFSPFIDSSLSFKAFREGIVGLDCGFTYVACEPKLKKRFLLHARSMQAPADKSAIVATPNEKEQA